MNTVKECAARVSGFAKTMHDEATTAFLNGEANVARLILHDLINASVGFEYLASETKRPSKSLHRGQSRLRISDGPSRKLCPCLKSYFGFRHHKHRTC